MDLAVAVLCVAKAGVIIFSIGGNGYYSGTNSDLLEIGRGLQG
jgi:hypothetical protein